MTHRQKCLSLVVWMCIAVFASSSAQAIQEVIESGPVKVTVNLSPEEPRIGDSVTLKIDVLAQEGVEVLMPEFGEALERFSIVDFVPRQSIDDQGNNVLSQTYRLESPSSGKQSVPPILIEYADHRPGKVLAPEGLDAYEIMTPRLDFVVQSVVPQGASMDLKPPLGRIVPPEPPGPRRWPWLVAAAILLGGGGFIAAKMIAEARRRSSRRTAYQIARWRLDGLLNSPRLSAEETERFYVELSQIVRRYLEDRFDLRAPDLTTEEFLSTLKDSPDLSREHQGLLREFLKQADLVKFARVEPTESDNQRAIDAAARFLDETRENAPLMDVEDSDSAVPASQEVQHG